MLSALVLGLLLQSPPASEAIVLPAEPAPLHGTLLSGEGERAVAVILPGSGPTDRDGNNAMGVQAGTYRLLAEGLAGHGITTLRADKRGVGESAAAAVSEESLRFETYSDDARAWVSHLVAHTGRPCVWLIGHSEGALVAQVAAVDNPEVCGLVLLAGAGRPAHRVIHEQLSTLPPLMREPAQAGLEALARGETVAPIPGLGALFRPSVQPYLISWFRYDPAELARAWTGPLLVVSATHDIQVPPADADALMAAQPAATRLDLIGANHVLKDAPEDRAGNLAVYLDADAPLSEGLVEGVATFILAPRQGTSQP
ncbi:MAG: alpha/beta hydrolase [Brevundimonas sp.]|jgi:uncharacterized protein|uniref:alpha/beta hydrolase n=1 Tax=Brevundimonas sp. TaxID=1871086 RepID=UPI00391A2527